MATKDESRTYDVRTLERNLRRGLITRKDYQKWLDKLPDATDKAQESKPDESRDDRDDARYLPTAQHTPVLGGATAEGDEPEPGDALAEGDVEDEDEDDDEDVEPADDEE